MYDSISVGAMAAINELVYSANLTRMLFLLWRDALLWGDLWNEITISHHSQWKQTTPSAYQRFIDSWLTIEHDRCNCGRMKPCSGAHVFSKLRSSLFTFVQPE